MFGELTLLSFGAIIFTSLIVLVLFIKKEFKEIIKYLITGLILAMADLAVELLGTSGGHWHYTESVLFVFGSVPIELLLLFFSTGIVGRLIFVNIVKLRMPIRINGMLYLLMLTAAILYVRQIYLGEQTSLIPLAVVIGIWGILNISEINREGAVIIAVLIAFADYVVESVILSTGSYGYTYGFNITIPVLYGLLGLGLLAVMEKLNKLDHLMDTVFVRSLLHLFGVYREKYKTKVNEIKSKVKKKINETF